MQTTRRTFLKYMSLLSLSALWGGSTLMATETGSETIGSTHMDPFFDPDGWL